MNRPAADAFARANADADSFGLGRTEAERGQFVATLVAIEQAFERQRVWRAHHPLTDVVRLSDHSVIA